MLVTHGHGFNPRDEFFAMFDALGADITWRSVEHPAADVLLQPKYSDEFDVYVFYDRAGSTDKTLKLYDGHFHDLLNDLGKDTVTTDITAWIEARLPSGAKSGAVD